MLEVCVSPYRLVHSNLHCKEALVSSKCGESARNLAFHLLKLDWATRDTGCHKPLSQQLDTTGRAGTDREARYSGPCILRPPIQPGNCGPKFEVLKWRDI